MRDVSSADSKHGDSASVSESASSPVYRVTGQDSLRQSISGRGHADEPRLRAGAPFFASSSFVCAGPALGNARIPHHLPWLLTLSHLLRRVVCSQLYSAAPELFTAAVRNTETVSRGAFAGCSRAETVAAGWRV